MHVTRERKKEQKRVREFFFFPPPFHLGVGVIHASFVFLFKSLTNSLLGWGSDLDDVILNPAKLNRCQSSG